MATLLDRLRSPEDLRALPVSDLKQVAEEIRQLLRQVVSEGDGHLASNLGTVELTIALHYVFETPKDKLIWDVGHQSYSHKILTGRRDRFPTIRQRGGLSGFTCRAESEHDHFGGGHASTSISAALGVAEGMRHGGQAHLAIAIIGDGSITGGLAYEALNNAGHIPAKNLVVVFNENDLSIDSNVGALCKFVNHTITHPGYNRLRKEMRGVLGSLAERGVPLYSLASRFRKSVKNIFSPGMLFECFGFRYFGPVNGHDLDALLETLRFITREGAAGGPYLVHVRTTKGRGSCRGEERPSKCPAPKKPGYPDVFVDTLIRLAKEDPRIVAVTATMPGGTGLSKFQKEFPARGYDVGIAEGHAVTFAAGLATEGFRPVAAICSTFLQRAYDQIIHDVAIQRLPVIFAVDRAGLVGADGATHQGAFDLSYLRAVPNLVIMAPKDEGELQDMIKTAVQYQGGPVAIRYPRGEVVGIPLEKELRTLPIGEAELLNADDERLDVLFVGLGYGVQTALEAQRQVRAKGFRTGLINARFVKPLDEKLLWHWAEAARLIVTVEENTICGGFGSAVTELLQKYRLLREVLTIGMPDAFIEHATPKEQRGMTGLDGTGTARRTLERLRQMEETYPAPHPPGLSAYDTGIILQ